MQVSHGSRNRKNMLYQRLRNVPGELAASSRCNPLKLRISGELANGNAEKQSIRKTTISVNVEYGGRGSSAKSSSVPNVQQATGK